ncbi:hypothetical protein Tco_1048328, partial [Tanacetum coccineum]
TSGQITVLPPRTAEEDCSREKREKKKDYTCRRLGSPYQKIMSLLSFIKWTESKKEMWEAIKSRLVEMENPEIQKLEIPWIAGVSTEDPRSIKISQDLYHSAVQWLEVQVAMISMRMKKVLQERLSFARECRFKGTQVTGGRDAWNSGKQILKTITEDEDYALRLGKSRPHTRGLAKKAVRVTTMGWNNVQKVIKKSNFVRLQQYKLRTGSNSIITVELASTKNFSTARGTAFTDQTVLTNTAMKVNTVKPIVIRVKTSKDLPSKIFQKTSLVLLVPERKATPRPYVRPKHWSQILYNAIGSFGYTIRNQKDVEVEEKENPLQSPFLENTTKIVLPGTGKGPTGFFDLD